MTDVFIRDLYKEVEFSEGMTVKDLKGILNLFPDDYTFETETISENGEPKEYLVLTLKVDEEKKSVILSPYSY